MTKKSDFANRLLRILEQKNISARSLSISLGYNEGYINKIINGTSYPTMENFFYICDYLEISASDFLNFDIKNPTLLNENLKELNKLNDNALNYHLEFLKEINKKQNDAF